MIAGSCKVSGDTLYFYVNIHDPTTGGVSDATALPTWSLYRRETYTAVTTGTMQINTDAATVGFYSESLSLATFDPGEYVVYVTCAVAGITGSTSFCFEVGGGPILVRTTISALSTQVSFTLAAGPTDANALIGHMIVVRSAASVDQFCVGLISAYTTGRVVTLAADPAIYTMAVGDFAEVYPVPKQLPAAVGGANGGLPLGDASGRVDLGKWIGTAPLVLSSQQVQAIVPNTQKVDVETIKTQAVTLSGGITLPAATVASTTNITAGTVTTSTNVTIVNGLAAGVITAASIATGAIDADAIAADAVTEIRAVASGTSDSGSTTTMVDAARTEADTDYWKGALIVFTSGTIAGQSRVITAFDAATDTITFAPATTQAVATQTYEIWPIGDFLRPTTSGRTLDVSAGGEAGLDWANVGSPTTTVGLSGTTVGVVTTYAGNTLQTGDSFARLGAPAGASVSADVAAVKADTVLLLADGPAAPPKNIAFTYVIKMVDSTDHVTPKTGLTVTMTRSIDGAAFGAATGTVAEISTGHYKVDASAADMNGNVVTHRFTGTAADDLTVEFKTVS
jgi:hypothetical protein